MPTNLVITAINIRSLKVNSKKEFEKQLYFLLNLNSEILIITEANTTPPDWDRTALDFYRFELSRKDFFLTEPDTHDYQRRGIIILYKKNINIKVVKIEQINYNLVRIEL